MIDPCEVCEDYDLCPSKADCNVYQAYREDPDEWIELYYERCEYENTD